MGRMFSMLPEALTELCERPSLMDTLLHRVFAPCPGDADSPVKRTLVIKVMRPVAELRIRMLTRMAPEGALEKIGEAFGQPLEGQIHYGRTLSERIRRDFDPRAENFAPMTVKDKHGNVAVTAPYFVRNTAQQEVASRAVDIPTAAGSALALGAITAALGEPTLLGKIMAASLLGAASVGAFSLRESRDDEKVTTESCEEIPMTTITESWKFKKTAGSMPRFGTVAGLALPPALALDYMYNKWRYGDMADVKAEQPGISGMALKAGRFVKEHPVLTTIGSGLIGSQMLRMLRFGRRIVPPVTMKRQA